MNRAERRRNGITKLSPDDKGNIGLVMANKGDQVIVEFAKNIRWFSMGRAEGMDFIAKLQAHVDKIPNKETTA